MESALLVVVSAFVALPQRDFRKKAADIKHNNTMLIVDDLEMSRDILQNAFMGEYDVLLASNGAEALSILNTTPVSIVLLDLVMPVMGGEEVIRRMREHPDLRDIPVVVITANEDNDSETRLLDMGVADFMRKPFELKIAVRRVRNIISRRQANLIARQNELLLLKNKEEQRYRIVLEHAKTLVIEYDYTQNSFFIDPHMGRHVFGGLEGVDLTDPGSLRGVVYRPDYPALKRLYEIARQKKAAYYETDLQLLTPGRSYEWFHLALTCVPDENGNPGRAIGTINNIDKSVRTRKKLEFLASRDSLTNIYNKTTFTAQTKELIKRDPSVRHAIIRMDIERFRTVNQIFGAVEGDRMLRYIAVKVQECIESEEIGAYCRMDSDVFAVCVPEKYVDEVTGYMQSAVKQYPLRYEITLSFGIYVIDDADIPVSTMLDRAAVAQKTIKGSYLKHVAYFSDTLRNQERIEQDIIAQMESALEGDQFRVYLQPKCRMDTGEIVGAEALVRWLHPEKGIIPPGLFIPPFERSGFITELDEHVWEITCRLIRKWINKGMPVVPISVNISRVDLYNPKLKDIILKVVDRNGIPHEYIEFELTESAFVSDIMQLYNFSDELRGLGFHVLMDDFGSGYSSLNVLKDIFVDVLKIDMRFLSPSANDERSAHILTSVVSMAKSLKLTVVVEGVETSRQVEFLTGIGCKFAQGYYFYKPMPISEFEALLGGGAESQ